MLQFFSVPCEPMNQPLASVLITMSTSRQAWIQQQKAQGHLCTAILSERSKQWQKAVEHYEKLLRILCLKCFTEHGDMNFHQKQLIYETYYHLGIAYQNINQHEKAVLQYTKALHDSSIRKKICTTGCSVRTFLQTPVLTRRAFAFVKCGETKKALQDAETAAILDNLNPDVYCIRALVWCSMQKEKEAIKDLNYSLHLNPSHVCSLLLRGNIQKHMTLENNACISLNDDQRKALQINYSSSIQFLHVKDFNSVLMSEFYNSLLWSLNVPHTVMYVSLPSACSSVKGVLFHSQRATSAPVLRNQDKEAYHLDHDTSDFLCSPITDSHQNYGLERRINYGRAVSAYCSGIRGKQSPVLSDVRCRPFSKASSVGGVNADSLSLVCSTTAAISFRGASLQKKELRQKIYEATGFSVFERANPGTLARMYNKPWNIDNHPINNKAPRK
ncbi:uncharacterized protein [Hyperolius riggenbachi]|uniref:uncharacterized protein isoform X2 n=1 Tax=Hyperolius riggenbachi TaxID=752182 RepID=UPI0035A34A2B